MLAKKQRLSRSLFTQYFASGKRIHGLYTTLIISPAPSLLCSVVVSKKVAKKAHDRNRIRRQLYTLVRGLSTPLAPQLALIIVAKPAIRQLTKSEFRAVLKTEIGRGFNNR